jgi:quinol monooxygenase YgiN
MSSLFISRFSVAADARDEFLKRFADLYRLSKPILDVETTILFYGWSRSGQYVAVESYRDEERLNAMRDTEGFKAGFEGLMQCCDGPMTLELFSAVDLEAPTSGHDKALFDELYPLGESRFHPEVDGKKTLIV